MEVYIGRFKIKKGRLEKSCDLDANEIVITTGHSISGEKYYRMYSLGLKQALRQLADQAIIRAIFLDSPVSVYKRSEEWPFSEIRERWGVEYLQAFRERIVETLGEYGKVVVYDEDLPNTNGGKIWQIRYEKMLQMALQTAANGTRVIPLEELQETYALMQATRKLKITICAIIFALLPKTEKLQWWRYKRPDGNIAWHYYFLDLL